MTRNLDYLPGALCHLHKHRPLRPVLKRVGEFQPRPIPTSEYFRILTFSIVSQMLSVKAADTIKLRLIQRVKPHKMVPQGLLALSITDLREVGLSNSKAQAMHDLAQRVETGVLPLKKFPRLENDEIIEHLTQVKGIGRWTAEMFLMFGLVRPDVWPVDDLGLRAAIKKLDQLPEMPTKGYTLERGEVFAPYRTIACWYLWQSLSVKE